MTDDRNSRVARDSACVCWIGAIAAFLTIVGHPDFNRRANAQIESLPPSGYFIAKSTLEDGDTVRALRDVRAIISRNSLTRNPVTRLCYHTLAGECFYQMGDNSSAMEQYTAALQTWQTMSNFLLRCTFPTQQLLPDTSVVRPPITWTGRSRPGRRVRLNSHFFITVGGLGAMVEDAQGRKGIALNLQTQRSVMGIEVLRCIALALRRRAELLGPLAQHDPLTSSIMGEFSRPLATPNHYSGVWVRMLSGLALLSTDRAQEAATELNASLSIAGMEHPLTCIALLELGKLAMKQKNYQAAQQLFLDATFSAAENQMWLEMSEAFRHGMLAQLARGERTPWAPLAAGAAWARRGRMSSLLTMSLFASLAENLAASGQSAQAIATVDQARRDMGRRSVQNGLIGARLAYQAGLAGYQMGNGGAADNSFGAALPIVVKSSKWVYQTLLADQLFSKGVIGGRAATKLYEQLLRDPVAEDWNLDPTEALAVLMSPNELAMEHWFELAIDRKEFTEALRISDLIRRRRFFRSLPLGGRMVALRWIAEAPESQLTLEAARQRQVLLNTRPAYAQLSKQAAATRAELAKLPLDAPDPDSEKQRELLEQLSTLAGKQELMLRAFALDRLPSELAFPPPVDMAVLQKKLKPKQAVLAYFSTSKQVYGFAISQQDYYMWKVAAPRAVRAELSSLMKNIGNRKANVKVSVEAMAKDDWKEDAKTLRTLLFPKTEAEGAKAWEQIEELAIVPDSVLWYLPFELLPTSDTNPAMMVDTKRIRYSPTLSLAYPDVVPRPLDIKTAIVAQRVMPEDTVDEAKASAKKIADARGGVAVWDLALPGPSSLIGSISQQMIVWSNLPDSLTKSPFGWSVMLLDRGKPGSTSAHWMQLPWGGPSQIALPGFHSFAESGIGSRANGNELFLASLGLMADGTRTVLLSRWTVGGQSTRFLIGEAMQEMPHRTAVEAWQRAVQLFRAKKVDPKAEPRIVENGDLVSGEHPLLWAGYLLIDAGDLPRKP